jgi:hypothetical protein
MRAAADAVGAEKCLSESSLSRVIGRLCRHCRGKLVIDSERRGGRRRGHSFVIISGLPSNSDTARTTILDVAAETTAATTTSSDDSTVWLITEGRKRRGYGGSSCGHGRRRKRRLRR